MSHPPTDDEMAPYEEGIAAVLSRFPDLNTADTVIVQQVLRKIVRDEDPPPYLLKMLLGAAKASAPATKAMPPTFYLRFDFVCPDAWLPKATILQIKIDYGMLYVKPAVGNAFADLHITRHADGHFAAVLEQNVTSRIVAFLTSCHWEGDGLYAISAPHAANGWCVIDPVSLVRADETISQAMRAARRRFLPYVRIQKVA
jgi:hypothetical protein